MQLQRLKSYLDDHHVQYTTIEHAPAFTAQEIAQVSHFPGKEMAKSVMVMLNGQLVETVMPATRQLDLETFKHSTGAYDAELATEAEFENTFPDCEVGAMPPCGNLYGLSVYVSPELQHTGQIMFNAGSHSELIRMQYKDYERLVKPTIVPLTRTD
jgi:Ala-tRNA(Pro) deacylase